MPVNKNALIRYNALDRCFRNTGRRYYFGDLLEVVNKALFEYDPDSSGIEIRQLRSDISFMRSEAGYGAPIETFRDGKKGYYQYSDPTFSINQSPINETEAEKLKSAITILQRFEGSPEFEWVSEIGPLLQDQFDLDNDDRKIIGHDSNIDYSGYEFISPFFNAISNKRVLRIHYKSFQGKEFNFDFHPYYLKQFNNRWFVFGLNESNGIPQWNIPLDRVVSMEEVAKAYVVDTTDWEDYFFDIIGVTRTANLPIEEVELKFSKDQAPYVVTKPLHPSQRKPVLNEDGSVEIRINVIPNFELERMIISYGAEVEVLAPKRLRESIAKTADKIKVIYECR